MKKTMRRKVLSFTVLLLLTACSANAGNDVLWREKKESQKQDTSINNNIINRGKSIFVKLAKELDPAVVNIYSTRNLKMMVPVFPQGGNMYGGPEDLFGLFENFFNGGGAYTPRVRKEMSLGSGFIINENGYILTNSHVVNNADEIMVKLNDERKLQAKIVGVDKETDIALIKINDAKKLSYAPLGDSSKLEVGEWVMAIGNPFGHSHSVTAGIVSAKGRVLPEVSGYNDFIQTDASINQGNSGGPLINTNGEVIGINTAIDPRAQGIGFAIPIDTAKKILPAIQMGKNIKRGWLGVSLGVITDEIAESLGMSETTGALVVEAIQGTPAFKAGIRNYDVILGFDNDKVESSAELIKKVSSSAPGSTHTLIFVRNGKQYTAKVILGDREEGMQKSQQQPQAPVPRGRNQGSPQDQYGTQEPQGGSEDSIANKLGLYVEDLSMENIQKYRLHGVKTNSGVIVVQSGPPASKNGIIVGDIIIEVNKTPVSNTRDLNRALKSGSNLIRVSRGGTVYLFAIK